ncbi:MAG: hypothetical protein Q8N76_03955, partial [Candidatus Omnitrophota bacterium]|nr:hypothetical protein [Candidatus Omnitrophota bacterium]
SPNLKSKIFQLIGGAKGIKSGQITLPVMQLLVRELYNPAARDLSSRMLKAITIQDLNSRRFLLEALISDKILADIKGDTAMGNLSMSIIGVFSRNDILEIEKMSIDPKVRIEAGRILARGLDRGDLLGLGFLRRHI